MFKECFGLSECLCVYLFSKRKSYNDLHLGVKRYVHLTIWVTCESDILPVIFSAGQQSVCLA